MSKERALFVGDLSFNCTEWHLEQLFSQCGKIEKCEVKRNLSYGFVTMATVEAAFEALATLNGTLLLGRNIKVNWAAKNRRQGPSQWSKAEVVNSVHVTFTGTEQARMSDQVLRDTFSFFGFVMDANVKQISFPDPGSNGPFHGYGFVQYPSNQGGLESAMKAANEFRNGKKVHGVFYKAEVSKNLRKQFSSESPVDEVINTNVGMPSKEETFYSCQRDQTVSPTSVADSGLALCTPQPSWSVVTACTDQRALSPMGDYFCGAWVETNTFAPICDPIQCEDLNIRNSSAPLRPSPVHPREQLPTPIVPQGFHMCPGRNDLGLAMMWSQGPLQCGDGRVFLSSPPLGTTLYCIPYGTFSCNSMGTMAMGDGMMALGYQIQSYPPHGMEQNAH